MNFRKFITMVVVFVALLSGASFAQQTFYVDNLTGNDANSGTTVGQAKATVNSAMIAAPAGSIISVNATGVNYIEATPVVRGTYTFTSTNGTPIFNNGFSIGSGGWVGGGITGITASPNSVVTTAGANGIKNGDVIYIDGTGVAAYDKKYFTASAVTGNSFTINNTSGGALGAGGNVAARGDVTFTGPFQFNSGLNLNVGTLTGGDQVTVKTPVYRTELGSIVSGALVFSGNVNIFYDNLFTATAVTITTGLEWPTALTANNVNTQNTSTGGITLKLDNTRTMKGILTTVGAFNLNSFQFNINGDNTHAIGGNVTGTGPLYFTQAAGGATIGGTGAPTLPNIVSDNTGAVTPTLTINNTVGTVGSLTANNAAGIAANMAGNTGNILLNGSGNIVTTGNASPTTSGTVTGAATSTGNITLNNSAANAYTTGTITQSGTGTITFGGNVNAINVGTSGSSTNVVLNTAIPAFNNTAAVAGTAVIAFTNVPVTIWGSVTNSVSFSGSSNKAGNNGNGLITFASTTNTVTLKNTLTNSVSGSYAFTGGGTGTGNGDILFATTTGNLTFAGVTNSATLSEPNGPGNAGRILATAAAPGNTATLTFTAMLNNSTYSGGDISFPNIDGAITGTTITQTGNVAGGQIALGNGGMTFNGDITNSRVVAGSNITIGRGAAASSLAGRNIVNSGASNITFNSVSAGATVNLGTYGITSSGSGTISFPNATGVGTFAFTSFTVSAGTVSFGNGTGAITATGVIALTAGTVDFGTGVRTVTFSNATIQFGGVATKVTFSNAANVQLIFAQPIPNVNQTITLGTLDETFPGWVDIQNTAAIPAPYVFFRSAAGSSSNPGNLYILNTGGNANGLRFDTGNPAVVNTVQLDNARLYVGKNSPAGSNGKGFQNTSGYTTVNGGFVMMAGGAGAAAQVVNTALCYTGATFGNFGVANNDPVPPLAVPCVNFATAVVMMGDFYLAAGNVNPANLDFQAPSPYSTIYRTEGTFSAVLPDPTTKVNITYYGGDKTTSNEVPATAGKLWNLTVATTNGAKPGYGIITMSGSFTVSGTLTINANQALYTAANALTIAGSAAVINGYLVDDGGVGPIFARVTLACATGTTFTGSGFLPALIVGNNSLNNSVTGYTGVYAQGFGTDGKWGGVGGAADDFTTADGSIYYQSGADTGSSLTVGFTGAGPHFGHLVMGIAPLTTTGTETFSLASNVVMFGNITQGAGVIALGDYTLTQNGTAFTMNVDGTAGVTVSSITSNATGGLIFVTSATALNVTTTGGGAGPATIAANVTFNSPGNTINLPAYVAGTTDMLDITGNVTLSDNAAGNAGTTVDVGNGNNLSLGGTSVMVSANSKFTAAAGGTTGILTLFNAGANTLLTFTIPASSSVANLTVSGNVTLAGGIASSTLTVTNFVHTAGLFTFGSANLQIGNATAATFSRTGATAAYSGSGWLIWNSTNAAGFAHSTVVAAGAMTINNFQAMTPFTLQNARNLNIVQNLYLSGTGTITNQVGGTGGGYIFCGDANNVPLIRVLEPNDILVNALQFNNANADFTFNGPTGNTITSRVWPATATLARNVIVNMAAAGNTLSLPGDRTINNALTLTAGVLTWDSPTTLTMASGSTITRNVNGSLNYDANANGTTGTLTAPNVNLVFTGAGIGITGIEYSDPVIVNNLTLGLPNGSTLTLNSARTVAGVVTINGAASVLTVNANTTFSSAQTIATGTIVVNSAVAGGYTLTLAGTTLNTMPTLTANAPNALVTCAGPLTITGLATGNITVTGVLTLTGGHTTGTITASSDVTVGANANFTATSNLVFVGTSNATVTVPAAGSAIGALTLNKTNNTNTVTLAGGNLTLGNTLTFINGLFLTGANRLNLFVPTLGAVAGGAASQGFTRAGVTGTNLSHVVGNVAKTLANTGVVGGSSEPRSEFPIGSLTAYKPVAITFNPAFGLPTMPNATIVVGYTDANPNGAVGLPIKDGVATGIDVSKYPNFYWTIATTPFSVGPSTPFDLELTATGFTNFDDINNVRILRRHGLATDVTNQWLLQGTNDSYDNSVNAGVPTIIQRQANAGLRLGGAVFTLGLKSNMKINPNSGIVKYINTYKKLWLVLSTGVKGYNISDLVTGNIGALTFVANSSNNSIATAAAAGSTLQITPVAVGDVVVTVIAQDLTYNDFFAYSIDVNVGLTDVQSTDQLPTEFALFQNYPNPFNPTTNIKFDLPKESNVTLKVYNILGEEVTTLVNKVMPAGHQVVTFDASRLASGMYIYRIEAGNFVSVKKMLLMK